MGATQRKSGRKTDDLSLIGIRRCVAPEQSLPEASMAQEEGLKRIELSAEWICIRRQIAGLETRINVPTASYRGVNLRSVPNGGMYEIVLMHMDASLEVILSRTSDDSDIIADWRSYARQLDLPLLVEDALGHLQPVEDSGSLGPFARRSGSPLKNRRPRFLARRHVGRSGVKLRHQGEWEMFAWG